jgi:hypothetical protein
MISPDDQCYSVAMDQTNSDNTRVPTRREELAAQVREQQQKGVEPIMQFFAYDHLPPKLREVSAPFGKLAQWIADTLPQGAEKSVCLRKILEAKDAGVRAMIGKPSPPHTHGTPL